MNELDVLNAIRELDERGRNILVLRFGLNGYEKPKTLEAIGKLLGVSRERARQLQNIALSQIRRVVARKNRQVDVEMPVEYEAPSVIWESWYQN